MSRKSPEPGDQLLTQRRRRECLYVGRARGHTLSVSTEEADAAYYGQRLGQQSRYLIEYTANQALAAAISFRLMQSDAARVVPRQVAHAYQLDRRTCSAWWSSQPF